MSAVMDAPADHLRVADPSQLEPAPTAFTLHRLHAERLIEAHLPVLRRMHGNPGLMENLGGVCNAAESSAALEQHLAHWERFGFGLWILRELATGRVAGSAGLCRLDLDGVEEVELCCALFPECWGRGLGTEAARACVTIGRDWLGLPSVVGLADPAVPGQRRVLGRAGLMLEREVMRDDLPRLLFRTD